MRTLDEAINKMENRGGAGASLRKHLLASGIESWEDITRTSVYEFRDHLAESVSPSTARTVCANFKALLNRYSDELELPKDWEKILSVKNDRPLRTFLTPAELSRFEAVPTKGKEEAVVKAESLVEAYTGARVSDIMEFTSENIVDGVLTYVSKKTGVRASVPVSAKVEEWIAYAQAHRDDEPTLMSRNRIIRRLAKKAGINETVVVYRAGRTIKAPKHEQLSSHTFRISFVTNLQKSGMDILSLSRLAGHTNTGMTERYCAPTTPELTAKAVAYLGC